MCDVYRYASLRGNQTGSRINQKVVYTRKMWYFSHLAAGTSYLCEKRSHRHEDSHDHTLSLLQLHIVATMPNPGKRAADAAAAPPAKRGGGGRGAGRKPAKRGLGDGAVDADGNALPPKRQACLTELLGPRGKSKRGEHLGNQTFCIPLSYTTSQYHSDSNQKGPNTGQIPVNSTN